MTEAAAYKSSGARGKLKDFPISFSLPDPKMYAG